MSQHQHLTGLTPQEVEESRIKHGANILTPPKRTPLWKLFLEKFGDPIIIILLLAGFCSLGIAAYEYSNSVLSCITDILKRGENCEGRLGLTIPAIDMTE